MLSNKKKIDFSFFFTKGSSELHLPKRFGACYFHLAQRFTIKVFVTFQIRVCDGCKHFKPEKKNPEPEDKFYKMFIEKKDRAIRRLYNQRGRGCIFVSKNKALKLW